MQNVVEHVVPRLEEIAFHRSLATTIRGAHAEDIKVKGGRTLCMTCDFKAC